MYCFIDDTTDPYYNLATEEYLLQECDKPIFRLWRNAPSVIVGRYQNSLAEVNPDFIRSNNIPVVRRLTGGGAVFHDLGNVNFTFIDKRIKDEDNFAMFRRFTAPIIDALERIGVNAYIEGRNDILIEGRKISGNAGCVYKGRVLQHGTILFSSSMTDLSNALNTRPEKFINKGVKSNVSRVTNIHDHLPEGMKGMDVEGFIDYLKGYIMATGRDCILDSYRQEDIDRINAICSAKYSTDKWNYGQSPKYRFTDSAKLPCGFIEVYLDVDHGIITDCSIFGDYFFTRPTEELCGALVGTPHKEAEIREVIKKYPLQDYFGADIQDELCGLLTS